MKGKPVGKIVEVEKYGAKVKANTLLEAFREDECLCMSCDNGPYGPNECPVAGDLYNICKQFNLAVAVCRCPSYVSPDCSQIVNDEKK